MVWVDTLRLPNPRLTPVVVLTLAFAACGSGARQAPNADAGSYCAVGAAGQPTELRCTGLYAGWTSKTLAPAS
jgi:hypothetical protein